MNLRLSLWLCLAVGCATAPATPPSADASTPAPGRPVALPGGAVEDRFLVRPVTREGQALEFFTDTGGGYFITGEAVARLKLSTEPGPAGEGGKPRTLARLPEFLPGQSIPLPSETLARIPVFSAPPGSPAAGLLKDGMLGQNWFAGRVWTFDYPGRTLWLRATGDMPAVDAAHRVALGFKVDEHGQRETDFPRIQARVDGETLDLLFDTGATTLLTDGALAALGDGRPALRAASFITRTTFERWRQRHPDWRVIEDSDRLLPGTALIEVPQVEVAGHTVGPVFFSTRADKNFHEFMSSMMDRRVEGALGGSALRFFRVTVDYPGAVAVFERAP